MTRAVVALGGNTLVADGESHGAQLACVRETVGHLDVVGDADRDLVWTHGNGPQVGTLLLEREAADTPERPLDVLVAETQGQIGYLLARVLDDAGEAALAVTTRAVVDPDDPAFDDPSKPVGPSYTPAEAAELPFETAAVGPGERSRRRVVPSPRPRRIVEGDAVASLVEDGRSVVCCGGGGVPVVETAGGYEGREAVVDKDHTSALLGDRVDADELVFVTDVPCAYLGYGSDDQRPVRETDPATLREHLDAGEFGEGSMRPKVEACVDFVEGGGDRAVITRPAAVDDALAGDAGTRVR